MKKPKEFWINDKCQEWFHPKELTENDKKNLGLIEVIEKSAADRLAEALKKCRGSMKYAYEDHADQYYLNCLEDIEKALAEYRGEE